MKKLKEIMDNKIVKKISLVLKIFITVLFVGFALVVFLQRFSDNKISIFNYRMFTVISGSMKPKYDIGDVLISKEVEPSEIKVGDDISYFGVRGDFKDKVITHEVVSVNKDEQGQYYFRAKGLTNLIEDPIVSENQLYGKIIHKSTFLSTIYRIVSSRVGFYLFIIIPIMYFIGSEIISAMLKKEEQRRNNVV